MSATKGLILSLVIGLFGGGIVGFFSRHSIILILEDIQYYIDIRYYIFYIFFISILCWIAIVNKSRSNGEIDPGTCRIISLFLVIMAIVLSSTMFSYEYGLYYHDIEIYVTPIVVGLVGGGNVGILFGYLIWVYYPTTKARKRTKREELAKIVSGLYDSAKSSASEAEKYFSKRDYRSAYNLYSQSLEKLKMAKKGLSDLGKHEIITPESIDKLISICEKNIESCNTALDKEKIEDIYENSQKMISQVKQYQKEGKLFKTRENLQDIARNLDEAFQIANKRNFTDASVKLQEMLSNVRKMMNEIDSAIVSSEMSMVKFEKTPVIQSEELEEKLAKIIEISETIPLAIIAEAIGKSKGETVLLIADVAKKLNIPLKIDGDTMVKGKMSDEEISMFIDHLIASYEQKKMD
ncbi:MAG: hypothetical protein QXL15_04550 [Candidatus Korarchaeota archaeon]